MHLHREVDASLEYAQANDTFVDKKNRTLHQCKRF